MHEDGSVERLDWMVAGDNHPMPQVTDPEGSPSLLIGAEP